MDRPRTGKQNKAHRGPTRPPPGRPGPQGDVCALVPGPNGTAPRSPLPSLWPFSEKTPSKAPLTFLLVGNLSGSETKQQAGFRRAEGERAAPGGSGEPLRLAFPRRPPPTRLPRRGPRPLPSLGPRPLHPTRTTSFPLPPPRPHPVSEAPPPPPCSHSSPPTPAPEATPSAPSASLLPSALPPLPRGTVPALPAPPPRAALGPPPRPRPAPGPGPAHLRRLLRFDTAGGRAGSLQQGARRRRRCRRGAPRLSPLGSPGSPSRSALRRPPARQQSCPAAPRPGGSFGAGDGRWKEEVPR